MFHSVTAGLDDKWFTLRLNVRCTIIRLLQICEWLDDWEISGEKARSLNADGLGSLVFAESRNGFCAWGMNQRGFD